MNFPRLPLFLCCVMLLTTASRAAELEPLLDFRGVECEGAYVQHLQGVCTDERAAIFWSWTDQLVKTDAKGHRLRQVPVAYHHGDLCYHDGRVYVAVNLGKFNELPGQENSWVYVYDADTLAEVARHPVPELVHGAGGMAWHDGTFLVIGGLPPGVNENYLYEYDADFHFRQRHVLPSGYTYKGIQTAAYWNGAWWFGTYGDTRYLMRADGQFRLTGKWVFDASLGLAPLGQGQFLIGSDKVGEGNLHRGRVTVFRFDETKGMVPVVER
jgi:hypothetical protein